jgi:hypothetical protein
MSITLPLQPQEEARLAAVARARGLSTKALLREVIEKLLETAPQLPLKPKKSAFGLLAKYGPGPSEQEIDESRREMFRGFAKDF